MGPGSSLPDEVLQELPAGVFPFDGLGHAGRTGQLLLLVLQSQMFPTAAPFFSSLSLFLSTLHVVLIEDPPPTPPSHPPRGHVTLPGGGETDPTTVSEICEHHRDASHTDFGPKTVFFS